VDRPAAQPVTLRQFAVLFDHRGGPDQVMVDIALADGVAAALVRLDVVDFLDLHRRDVAVLVKRHPGRFEVAPPVGGIPLHDNLRAVDNQVGFADRPRGLVRPADRGGHVRGVAARRAGFHPLRDPGDLVIRE
jgi:hypothetical protein